MHSKMDVPEKLKAIYNLERREYIFSHSYFVRKTQLLWPRIPLLSKDTFIERLPNIFSDGTGGPALLFILEKNNGQEYLCSRKTSV
jgi:hypothetical protein